MRVRASKAQSTHTDLKKKIAEAQRRQEREQELEKKEREEAADKAVAEAMLKEANVTLESLRAEVDAMVSSMQDLDSQIANGTLADPIASTDAAEQAIDATLESVMNGKDKVLQATKDGAKDSGRGPLAQARRSLSDIAAKFRPLEEKCKKEVEAIRATREKAKFEAREAVAIALCTHAKKVCLAPDALFARLSGGQEEISVASLRAAVAEAADVPGEGVSQRLELGLRLSGALTKLRFLSLLQDFKRCVKEIALTTAFEVRTSSTVRKIDVGEFLEIVGEKRVDTKTGLERVKCRALRDLREGWITTRGNQGTAFLEQATKPFLLFKPCAPGQGGGSSGSASSGLALEEACESGSNHLQAVGPGEVLEVLEGPRQEPPLEVARIRGRAVRDGRTGWATLREPSGVDNFRTEERLLVCRGSIAITSAFDIGTSMAIRKLETGEIVEQLEDPKLDEVRKLSRVHIRARRDGREGWATIKGNQGTHYLSQTESHRTVVTSVPLEKEVDSGKTLLRQLEEGEMFEVLEGPVTEQQEGALRVCGRALHGGSTAGWLTLGDSVRPWATSHRCVRSVELRETSSGETEATVLRQLEVGELLEALELPVYDEQTRVMHLQVRAERDGIVGLAQMTDAQGTAILESTVKELFAKE